MDTHIRWKVKRRIRDVQVTLAVILLFVTTQASSGKSARKKKKERKKMRDCVVCAWSWEKFSPPPPKTHLCAFFFLLVPLIYSAWCSRNYGKLLSKCQKVSASFFFPEKKRSFLLDTFVFSSSWKADLQKTPQKTSNNWHMQAWMCDLKDVACVK